MSADNYNFVYEIFPLKKKRQLFGCGALYYKADVAMT